MRFKLILLLSLSILLVSAVYAQNGLKPNQIVEKLVNASHGLTWASGPEITEFLERIRQQPDPYLHHLLEYLTIDTLAKSEELLPIARRAEIAAIVLVQAGGAKGRDALVDKLREFFASRDTLQLQIDARSRELRAEKNPADADKKQLIMLGQQLGRMATVERTIVNAFADTKDPKLKDLLLKRIDQENYSTQLTFIHYLQMAGKGDTEIKKRLEEMLNDQGSLFYRSQFLRTILETLDESSEALKDQK